jgi:hypothetical protein
LLCSWMGAVKAVHLAVSICACPSLCSLVSSFPSSTFAKICGLSASHGALLLTTHNAVLHDRMSGSDKDPHPATLSVGELREWLQANGMLSRSRRVVGCVAAAARGRTGRWLTGRGSAENVWRRRALPCVRRAGQAGPAHEGAPEQVRAVPDSTLPAS